MAAAVLAIFGPTASGKSAVAAAISARIPSESISTDSMQVYRGVPVLTAQPAEPTRLVGIFELDHEASVAEYQSLAQAAIDEAIGCGRIPVVVGGTGLYLRAALSDMHIPPPPAPGARARWERVYDQLGPEGAHELLSREDLRAAERVHPNDRRRIVRALELAEAGASLAPERDRLWEERLRLPTLLVGLALSAAELERRIVARTAAMFASGVEDEVRRALGQPLSQTARQIIGLEEIARLPRAEAERAIVLRTRRYAAYQRKWMRRIPGLATVAAERPPGEIADEILEMARSRERVPAHGRARRA